MAMHCGPYLLVSIYISPRISLREFSGILDDISTTLAQRVDRIIIGGDFNAKSNLWSAGTTDSKELVLVKWAAERDFRILNVGNAPTCVRPQGQSIVELIWSSPDISQLISD